jgi:flagellar biosynthesis/type III secretory pathway chaperone
MKKALLFPLNELITLVNQEITIFIELNKTSRLEKKAVVAFETQEIETFSKKRELLLSKLEVLAGERMKLTTPYQKHRAEKLGDLLRRILSQSEWKRVKPLINKLRFLSQQAKHEGSILQGVVNFATNFVNGVTAIIRGTPSVEQSSYSKRGKLKQTASNSSGSTLERV